MPFDSNPSSGCHSEKRELYQDFQCSKYLYWVKWDTQFLRFLSIKRPVRLIYYRNTEQASRDFPGGLIIESAFQCMEHGLDPSPGD